MKKILSTILALSLLTSALANLAVNAEDEFYEDQLYSDGILPTEEPLAEDSDSLDFDAAAAEAAAYESDNHTQPEQADSSVLSQAEQVEFSDEEVYKIPEEISETDMTANFPNAVNPQSNSYTDHELAYITQQTVSTNYVKSAGNVYIDDVTGALRYYRNDIAVPLETGMLSLDLVYDTTQAEGAKYNQETTNGGNWGWSDKPHYVNDSPLGVGWRFNLTHLESNKTFHLKDGRSFYMDSGTMCPVQYNDITYEYSGSSGYIITYLDKSKEYINLSGLLYKSIDKYGIETLYTYNSDKNLTSVESQGKKITIVYNDDEAVITKPNGSKVHYMLEDYTLTFGPTGIYTWQRTVKCLTAVYLEENNQNLCDTTFSYNTLETEILRYFESGIEGDEYAIYLLLHEIYNSDGTTPCYDYTTTKRNYCSNASSFYSIPSVSKQKIDIDDACFSAEYTETGYDNNSNQTSIKTYANNKIIKTEKTALNTTTQIYVRKDSGNILRSKSIVYYNKNQSHIPYLTKCNTYNNNGNYISISSKYTYNSKDQPLEITVSTEEGDTKTTKYTYYNNYIFTDKLYVNDNLMYTKEYYRDTYGDISDSYITDSNNICLYNDLISYDNKHRVTQYDILDKLDSDPSAEVSVYSTQYEYKDLSLPSRVYTEQAGTIIAEKKYTYNPDNGNILTETDGNGNTTKYTYNSMGNITQELYPNNKAINISYGRGYYDTINSYEIEQSNGYITKYMLSITGNVYSIQEKLPGSSQYTPLQYAEYDIYGNLTKETDASGYEANIGYDIFNRQTSVQYAQDTNALCVYYYDVFFDGNEKCAAVVTVDQTNKGKIEYYDLLGRNYKNAVIKNMSSLTSVDWENIIQLPSNAQLVVYQTNTFDDMDRIIKTLDGENRPVTYEYDVLGNITKQVTGNSDDTPLEVEYTYDAAGNVLTMNQAGHITTNEYDLAGRLIKTTDPMGFTETFKYDKAGNVIEAVDKNGDTCYNIYNKMNQIISSDKNNDYIDYTYDSNWPDKISSVSSGSSSINYTYNTDGTLASQTYSDGKKIEYTEYDANKKLLSMTDYFGNTTSYEYDGKNQISSISEQYKNNTDIKTTTYQYNENGTLSTVVLPEYVTRYYTYDYAGRISTLKNETGRVYSYSRHSYTYDNAGNITQETEQLGTNDTVTKSFSYDSLNRVSYETDGGYSNRYSYDSHNNLYSAIGYGDTYYEYDANNRLVSVEDLGTYAETADGTQLDDWYIDYEYDSNGNLLSSNKYSGQGYISNQCEYTYSAWGQLTNYSDSLGQGAEYAYYADGLRSSKKIGSNTIKYYYNGDTVINETKNGSQLATNVNGADGFISRYQSGRDNYFMFNAHGDTTLVFTGWRTGEYHYNAWGKDLSNYNYWSDANPIRYSGEYYDTESGMQYLRGRYYSPELRRFITEDPAKDGLNWYAYCSNNPIMFVDPSGEKYIADDLARWIWRQGAEYYLRNKKGWYLTATLLELSTYEEGQSFSAHNGEYAAELIKNDTSFRKFVNDIIWEEGTSKGEKYVYKATSYEFNLNNGDLGAAIHNADVYITADQLSNGSWSVYVQVHDTFDFTEFVNPLSYDTVKEMFLWTMNDLAYLDQSMNILTPVECWIDFCDIY